MILVTGGHGQLGTSLQKHFNMQGESILAPGHSELDVTNAEAVAAFFAANKPEIVIHCASFNRVDLAEDQSQICYATNVQGTKNVANACVKTAAYLLYISTDYVFDGTKNGEYTVTDTKNPLSVYGKTKSMGEDIVLAANPANAVLRTSWLFGPSSINFVEAILRASKTKSMIDVVADQIGSPTYTDDLAMLISEMAHRRLPGIFHGTSEGTCSWAHFAAAILEKTGSSARVHEVSSEEYGSRAVRPKNSKLDKSSLDRVGLARLPNWENALTRYLSERKVFFAE